MVPVNLPTLAWRDTAAFAPDASHTNLQKKKPLTGELNQNPGHRHIDGVSPRLSFSCLVWDSWVPNRKRDNSSGTAHTLIKAEGCKAGKKCEARILSNTCETGKKKKRYLSQLVLLAAHMTELAASAAPIFFVLLRGALCWFKAKPVEGLTAHLAVQHLTTAIPPEQTSNYVKPFCMTLK